MHFEGTKDPVTTGEVKGKLRNDRLAVIHENDSLMPRLQKYYKTCVPHRDKIRPTYALEDGQKKPKNRKQNRLVDLLSKAIIDYIRE